MMFSRRHLRCALVALVAMMVAGCSSGGAKHSTPTTARHVVVNLGPCPKTDSTTDLAKVNAGVKGLDRALVPIAAVRVRMCRYSNDTGGVNLIGERTMARPSNAARFEAEANRAPASVPTTLPPPPESPSGSQGLVGDEGCMQLWHHVVTFASDSQQVELHEDGCGGVSNGVLDGQSTAQWLGELQNYTTPVSGFAEGEMHLQGGPPPRDGKPHDQPLPGVVEVHRLSRPTALTEVTVGSTGRFTIPLPAGDYQLVGRPANTGIMSMTSKPFNVQVGRIVHVDLLEVAT